MSRACGPILGFRGQRDDNWYVAALVAHDRGTTGGALIYTETGTASPELTAVPAPLGDVGGLSFFLYELTIPLQADNRTIEYCFEGEERRWTFAVPSRGRAPRLAYTSCNGFSTPGDMKKIADKNGLWKDLFSEHQREPFDVLLMGGDQIYADQLWDAIPELRRFNELPRHERVTMVPGSSLPARLERFYAQTYQSRFAQPEVADVLASIPALMMWDDHDIFDGWGSYSDEEQASPIFRAVFDAARTCFALFQRQSDPRSPSSSSLPGGPGFNELTRIGNVGLLILDLRTERSLRQVLSPSTWNEVFSEMDRTNDLQHLLVLSSIPIVHPDMSLVERGLGFIPGMQSIEDDLHDQWISYNHKTEKLRLIHRLLDFADAKGTRVTILSGDVHVAALGVIESQRRLLRYLQSNVINQLTSSAIVHPPPPRVVHYFLEGISDGVREVDRDISAQMLKFPGTNYRIVAERNWLSMDFDERGRIWANWHVEGLPHPLTKVIHPCETVTASADPNSARMALAWMPESDDSG